MGAVRRSWHGVELRHLAALGAVVEEGSFHRAAKRLGYTQPAVSQQVAALERAVGQRLVERGVGEPVRLTAAGAILLHHAQAIRDHLSAARADVASLASGAHATLHVGVYQSAGAHLVPHVLVEFARTAPQVEVELTETVADVELFPLVEHGEVDLAFVVLPAPPGPFASVELLRDPYVLVARSDSHLASAGRPVSLEDIAALPLICLRACRSTEHALATLRSAGVEPHVVFRSNDSGIVQGMVAAGRGTGLLPSLAALPDDALAVIDVGDVFVPRWAGLAWHRDRSLAPVAEGFVETARRVCDAIARPGRSPRDARPAGGSRPRPRASSPPTTS